jgi:tryptophan 2,3-dioxygenase
MSGTPVEADAVRVRYEGQRKSATAFLAAEDVEDPEQRPVRRRIRAAAIFIETYRELPLLAWPREVVDGIIALEQRMVVFRQRHARMAELIIGRRVGTGGSTGVAYLDAVALRYRVFPDLWAVRTLLVRRDRSPEPENVEFYGFRFDTP